MSQLTERQVVALERIAERLEAESQRLEQSAAELLRHLSRATSLRPCECRKFHIPAGSDSILVDGVEHCRWNPCR